jgi:hypothetical protein
VPSFNITGFPSEFHLCVKDHVTWDEIVSNWGRFLLLQNIKSDCHSFCLFADRITPCCVSILGVNCEGMLDSSWKFRPELLLGFPCAAAVDGSDNLVLSLSSKRDPQAWVVSLLAAACWAHSMGLDFFKSA